MDELKKLKEDLMTHVREHTFDFNENREDINKEWMNEFKKLPRTFVGQMIESFDIRFEDGIIYITDKMLGFLGALAVLPLEFENMSEFGRYEVYLNNEPWGVVEYNGMPKNDPESGRIHFGAVTQLTLNQLIERVSIDIDLSGGNVDVSSDE